MRLSYEKKSAALRILLNEGRSEDQFYIRELFDDVVIFKTWNEPDTWQQAYEFDASGKPILKGQPKTVEEVTTYKPVKMSAEFSVDEGSILPKEVPYIGKIFQVGSFPDKNFSLTEAEADDAIANFRLANADNEHRKSQFDGKIGGLQRMWREGKEIFGEYRAPKALFDLLGKKISVSLQWSNRPNEPKRVEKIALAADPRITDAQMAAAFARSEDAMENPQFTQDDRTLLDRVKGLFSFGGGNPAPNGAPPATPIADPDAEIASLRAKLAASEESNLKIAAAKFADDAITVAKKATPAERYSLIAQFSLAAKADAAAKGTACFSEDGTLVEGDNLRLLRAGIDARPVNAALGTANFSVVTDGQPSGGSQPDANSIYKDREKQMAGGK